MTITIENPAADARFQAVMLRAHLRLLAAGLKNSRVSGTDVLRLAGRLTGTAYKRGQYAVALRDLQLIIDADA